jgi:hypothetical protein
LKIELRKVMCGVQARKLILSVRVRKIEDSDSKGETSRDSTRII